MTKGRLEAIIGKLSVADKAYHTSSILRAIHRLSYGPKFKAVTKNHVESPEYRKDLLIEIDALNDFLQEIGIVPKDKTILGYLKGE